MNTIKKAIVSIIMSTVIVLSCIPVAGAADEEIPQETMEKISAVYDIPAEDLQNMTVSDIEPLLEDLDSAVVEKTETIYVHFIEDNDGTLIAEEYAEAEFQQYEATLISVEKATDTGSWMKIVTSIGFYTGSTSYFARASYTWLTVPAFRLKDVVALQLNNGTIIDDTEYGYYTCSYYTSSGSSTTSYTYNFTGSDFTTKSRTLAATFNMLKPDTSVVNDKAYIFVRFKKSGDSDAVTSYYFHQKLAFTASFSISISNSSVSVSPSSAYNEFTGYINIDW